MQKPLQMERFQTADKPTFTGFPSKVGLFFAVLSLSFVFHFG